MVLTQPRERRENSCKSRESLVSNEYPKKVRFGYATKQDTQVGCAFFRREKAYPSKGTSVLLNTEPAYVESVLRVG